MRTGSVASVSRARPCLTKIATAGTSGSGIARTGPVGMLGPATGVVVVATSMIGAHLSKSVYCISIIDRKAIIYTLFCFIICCIMVVICIALSPETVRRCKCSHQKKVENMQSEVEHEALSWWASAKKLLKMYKSNSDCTVIFSSFFGAPAMQICPLDAPLIWMSTSGIAKLTATRHPLQRES
uniref:Uncharacterized protein n=1 Tax=Romanomermis culicivorax TaxID=13658 RepID=A0A915JW37_ROMCU